MGTVSGKVTLVGAGPGDPGLLTVKGRESLIRAEVVVYDRLVSAGVLAMIPESAERINVGKADSRHLVPQEEINKILLNKALEGLRVVRLKGGDPFVFGRGGEELELLAANGVEFEVVPGITSAVAAPSYAGIPVTHRDFCSSLHIVTGHARAGKELDIDFEALVRTGGTLVFLMGLTSMPAIMSGLIAAGMEPDMPAAVIEDGTNSKQRRVVATIETLPERTIEEKIHSPAMIVVGRVCTLAEDFAWFDKLPLRGRTIAVTRPRTRAGTLSNRLRELGAEVVEFPCIETREITPNPGADAAIYNIANYTWLALTSPEGAVMLERILDRNGLDSRALHGVKIACIGSGTAAELKKLGLRADYVPDTFDAAHLGEGLARLADGKVLILRAELGSSELTAALEGAGVGYDDIAVYRTVYENQNAAELIAMVDSGTLDCVTFTSASTVTGFVGAMGEDFDLGRIRGVCIGEQTAAEARKYGISVTVAEEATIDALVLAARSACRQTGQCATNEC